MDNNKINVSLYGGKSIFKGVRETPLEAEIIYCDQTNECQLYKEGKCLRCRKMFSTEDCKYGHKEIIKGYTSRASKYYTFKTQYQEDNKYNALREQTGATIAKVGDFVFLNRIYGNRLFSDNSFFIDKQALNDLSETGVLYRTLTDKPRAFFDNTVIKDYQEKIVPDLCLSLRKNFPEIAKEFFYKYPELDKAPNYVGKKAFINTLVNGSVIKDCHRCEWVIKDGKAYCDNYTASLSPEFYGAIKRSIVIELSGKETCEITDNSQVDENTKFV